MKFSRKANVSRIGVQLAGLLFEKHGYIFREQSVSDCGIDAHIERIQENNAASGKLIALQIKSGGSWFREKNETGFVYRGKVSHLNYWLGHSLPVLIVLCDIQKGRVYWQSISKQTVKYTGKGWKITVPYEQQVNAEMLNYLALSEKNTDKRNSENRPENSPFVVEKVVVEESAVDDKDAPDEHIIDKYITDEYITHKYITGRIIRKKAESGGINIYPSQWLTIFKRVFFYLYSVFCLYALFRGSLSHEGHFSFSLLIQSLSSFGQKKSLLIVLGIWCFWFIRYSVHFRTLLSAFKHHIVSAIKSWSFIRPRYMLEFAHLAKILFFYLYCIFCGMLLFSASLDASRNFSLTCLQASFSQQGSLLTIFVLLAIGLLLFFRGYLPGKKKHYSPGVMEFIFLIKGTCFYLYTIYCLFLLLGASLDSNDHVSFFHLMDEFFISDGGTILLLHTVIWLSWCIYRTLEPGCQYYSAGVMQVVLKIKRGIFYLYSCVCLSMVVICWLQKALSVHLLMWDDLLYQDLIIQFIFFFIVWLYLLLRWHIPGKKQSLPGWFGHQRLNDLDDVPDR